MGTEKEHEYLKKLDDRLWKIEIDLENVVDILQRIHDRENPGLMNKLGKILGL